MSTGPRAAPDISVIVPVAERPELLDELYREYARPLLATGRRFEFLFVTEPWGTSLTSEVSKLAEAGEPIRVLHGGQILGEAGLLRLGAAEARGHIVITLPPYHRVEADVLPRLVEGVEAGTDLVVARRWPRSDSWINRIQNLAFHAVLGRVSSGQRFRDVACGVRAMRRDLLRDLPLYGDFSRFLPLLAVREGYRVSEISAPQHEQDRQPRIYRPGVYVRRAVDLFGVFFLLRFIDKPLRFFGLVGSALFFAGGVVLAVLLAQRLGGEGIADRPLLLLGVLLVVVGIQAIALGLVGEIIVHLHASTRPAYRIAQWYDGAGTSESEDEGAPLGSGGPESRSDIA